jgi:hypothetical protein
MVKFFESPHGVGSVSLNYHNFSIYNDLTAAPFRHPLRSTPPHPLDP